MDEVLCIKGHVLPDDFHHGPEENREPCPECGSTARIFSVTASVEASISVTASVTVSGETSWRTALSTQILIDCEHLGSSWLVQASDEEGTHLGVGVADDTEDAGLLSAFFVAEALRRLDGGDDNSEDGSA